MRTGPFENLLGAINFVAILRMHRNKNVALQYKLNCSQEFVIAGAVLRLERFTWLPTVFITRRDDDLLGNPNRYAKLFRAVKKQRNTAGTGIEFRIMLNRGNERWLFF